MESILANHSPSRYPLEDINALVLDAKRQHMNEWYRADEAEVISKLLPLATTDEATQRRIQARAAAFVKTVRKQRVGQGGMDAFLTAYDLSSEEGIALMCVAESLLRIPDKKTVQKLIRDKIGSVNWEKHVGKKEHLFVNAATWGLMLTGKVMDEQHQDAKPFSVALNNVLKRGGIAIVYRAMRMLSKQFVMGRTIRDAIKRASKEERRGYRYSYDMLGEGARTEADAQAYFEAYQSAIQAIAQASSGKGPIKGPGISIKLTALHPRYEVAQMDRIKSELIPRVKTLVTMAQAANIGLTIDAEEAERLDISLMVFESLFKDPSLTGWEGFGLAVQAYQKRALGVLEWLIALSEKYGRRIMVRLVKGAYWDYEIKDSQVKGLSGYPVFTRKSATDVSYLACARKMLDNPHAFFAQFATHNAHSLATILEWTQDRSDFEFQCLHGMGQSLYDSLVGTGKGQHPCRVYAPVGHHENLLAYLVRRILENGANSSFVNRIVKKDFSLEKLTQDPVALWQGFNSKSHPAIPKPEKLYGEQRPNSRGFDLSDFQALQYIQEAMQSAAQKTYSAKPRMAVAMSPTPPEVVYSPCDTSLPIGEVATTTEAQLEAAIQAAVEAKATWGTLTAYARVKPLQKLAHLLEHHKATLYYLLMVEAGKVLKDAVDEVREAIDFCYYYSEQALEHADPKTLRGPTGELDQIALYPRGVVAAISPWNFPVAIYLGQVVAALAAGNVVISKPAAQTYLLADFILNLAWEAGIPKAAFQVLPGSGRMVGNALAQDERIDAILFTGSTDTAKVIQRNLAAREGAIVPLVAETGGQNAMIVDSSALPEQVVFDVAMSAFGSAGQRCSACRILCLQEDTADTIIKMLSGYLAELRVGDPRLLSTDIGPVIDQNALKMLTDHQAYLETVGTKLAQATLESNLPAGRYFEPCMYEIPDLSVLTGEVFGPILHVVRYKAAELDALLDSIRATGFGLTLGIHSRIDETIDHILSRTQVGNTYVNRNMIGAVVGVQPFGGEGLSGTGPKAGGPHYLPRLCVERTLCVNTTAMGGNASLLAMSTSEDI